VSGFEPLDSLGGVGGPVAPRASFADALLERCLDELQAARSSSSRLRRLLRRRTVRIVIALAVALALVATATATYLVLTRGTAATAPQRPDRLTLIAAQGGRISNRPASLAAIAVLVNGRLRRVWQCPHHTWCGELTSIAWSPDGKRLALTLGELGGRSGYVGLHVIDLRTGADTHVGVPAIPRVEREQSLSVLRRLGQLSGKRLGCALPSELDWAPDGSRLAYVCGDDLGQGGQPTTIYAIRADGSDRKRLPTGTSTAYWPSWSPDGTRIAFATQPRPQVTVRCCSNVPAAHYRSSVYTIRLDGSDRALVAHDASAPSWAPDGRAIAYESSCGIKVVTPEGRNATPPAGAACPHTGPAGTPVWSPDGTTIAIAAPTGIQLVRPDGTHQHRASFQTGLGTYGVGRPAWAPGAAIDRLLQQHPKSGL
jgi:Tol biopolymer transport system component